MTSQNRFTDNYLQYRYCSMSQEVKTIKKKETSLVNSIYHEAFFLKNDTQYVVEKLVPKLFLKNQNSAYIWIDSLKV